MRSLPWLGILVGSCYSPESRGAAVFDSQPDTPLDGTIDAATDGRTTGRAAGAQVQWNFDEGTGITAADSAALVPAYDLVRNEATLANSEWSNGGLTFTAGTHARTALMLTRPTTNCLANQTATLEAWFVPKNETQGILTRPAIIAGLSASLNSRSFEISQVGLHIIGRTRTAAPNALEMQASDVVTAGALIHVVLVQEQATQRLYINGVEKDSQISPLMAWESYAMFVGGDVGLNATWLGTVRAVVLYCSALTAAQVQGNFAFGPTL